MGLNYFATKIVDILEEDNDIIQFLFVYLLHVKDTRVAGFLLVPRGEARVIINIPGIQEIAKMLDYDSLQYHSLGD